MVGIEDDAVRAGQVSVYSGRYVPHRDRVVDIAADHIEFARPDRDDDVAVPRKTSCGQIVIGDWPATAPLTDQVAALRGVGLDPLGGKRGAGFEAKAVAASRVDVIGVRFGIGETAFRPGYPHHIGNKSG